MYPYHMGLWDKAKHMAALKKAQAERTAAAVAVMKRPATQQQQPQQLRLV